MPAPEPKPAATPAQRFLPMLSSHRSREVMVGAGGLMRRPSLAKQAEAERALQGLGPVKMLEAIRDVDVDVVAASLREAANHAFDAAFADSEGERGPLAVRAMQCLEARDAAESVLVAAAFGGHAEVAREVESLRARLAIADREIAHLARSLTGCNAARREELGLLGAEHRESAIWYSVRVNDDDLLVALGGVDTGTTASDGTASDLVSSNLPTQGSKKSASEKLTSGALLHLCLGDATDEARRYASKRCPEATSLALDPTIEAESTSSSS